jgi:phosphonate transport system substrate-binding protein
MRRRFLAHALFSIFIVTFSALAKSQTVEEYSFGVIPQSPPTTLAEIWTPLVVWVEKETGIRLNFKTAKNIQVFSDRVVDQQYDFVYLNPYLYTRLQKGRYQAFAKEKNTKLEGIIVVRKDSDLRTIRQLNQRLIVFPGKTSFGATLLPVAHLKSQNILFRVRYVITHKSVYLTVGRGLADAGGGIMKTFSELDKEEKNHLHILWRSPPLTPHPFAVHSRVPKKTAERVTQALVKMEQDSQGRVILKNLGFNSITRAFDKEYNDIRMLGPMATFVDE